jgi:tetratricopeptide (TPR) repeat protein
VYESLNRQIEAADSYSTAAAIAVSGRPRLYATIAQLRAGDPEAAANALVSSLQVDPNDASAHNALARCYADMGRPDDAFAEHVAALLVDANNPDAYMGIGQLHLNAGRYAEAALVLQRLVTLQPAYAEARYALGNALQRSGQREAGARELAIFQQLQAQQVEARRRSLGLGVIKEEAALRAAEGAFDRAAALWQQAIEREPGVASNHAALAAALAAGGSLDQAAQQYERAAALGGSADVYRQLAAVYGKLGRADDSARAHARYEQALLVPARDGGRH